LPLSDIDTFRVAATRVLPQESEGMDMVAQFKETDLRHRAFRALFAPYRSGPATTPVAAT